MASPDWTEYVDLTLYDLDAEDLFNEAIEYARNALPDWTPEAGNIEVVLLEAIATEAANVIAAINRVPGATTETLLKLFGVERSDGIKATTTLNLVMRDSNGYTIPAGSPFAYFPPDNATPLVYTTDDDLIVPNGSVSGNVSATASDVGTAWNEPAAGSSMQLLVNINYLQSATLLTKPSGGAEPELDSVFFQRAINTLQSYSAALTTPDQIAQYVLVNYPGTVFRCEAFDRSRAADRNGVGGNHTGYILVAVAGENADKSNTIDTQLTAAERQVIQDDLQSRVNPGLVVEVVNADIVPIVFSSLVVKRDAAYTNEQTTTAVVAALDSYFSPNNWNWSRTVRVNEVIALLDNVAGVDYVDGTPTFSPQPGSTANGSDLDLDNIGSLTTPDLVWDFTVT